jgi:Leucine-rich repeat (LRR) protein
MSIKLLTLFLVIIPAVVRSQCYSTLSQTWLCNSHSQSNNNTYQTTLNDPSLIQITIVNYHLTTFIIDQYTSTLRTLNASYNHFPTVVITSRHRYTSNLRQLILQSNDLEQFNIDTIVLPHRLERISLANNRLKILDARLFTHLTHLNELDLRQNQLKRVLPQLLIGRNLILENNPLECQCTSESYRTICEKATTIERTQVSHHHDHAR